jgi:hypothetical protein
VNRFRPYLKRLASLEELFAPWQDNDDDGFLSAIPAMPGETAADALRRCAPDDWSGWQ